MLQIQHNMDSVYYWSGMHIKAEVTIKKKKTVSSTYLKISPWSSPTLFRED